MAGANLKCRRIFSGIFSLQKLSLWIHSLNCQQGRNLTLEIHEPSYACMGAWVHVGLVAHFADIRLV